MGKSEYNSFMSDCLKTNSMSDCAAQWQSEKSNVSNIDATGFPILPAILGSASSVGVGYVIKQNFDGNIPFLEPYLPESWRKYSSFGMISAGAVSFIAGVLSNAPNLKSGLFGLGLGFLAVGLFNGVTGQSESAKAVLNKRFVRPRLRIPTGISSSGKIIKGVHDYGSSYHGSPSSPEYQRLKPYTGVEPGVLKVRESGLLKPASSFQKYSNREIIA